MCVSNHQQQKCNGPERLMAKFVVGNSFVDVTYTNENETPRVLDTEALKNTLNCHKSRYPISFLIKFEKSFYGKSFLA